MSPDDFDLLQSIDYYLDQLTQWVSAMKRSSGRLECAEATSHALGRAVMLEELLKDKARAFGIRPDTDRLREMLQQPAPKSYPQLTLVVDNTEKGV